MKATILMTIAIMMTPIYMMAYAVSNILMIKGREDMPTIAEWFATMKEI